MNLFKRKESRKHRKSMSTPVASKQHFSLILKKCSEVEFVSMLLKTDNVMVKLVTELYKSMLSVVCDFHFPRISVFESVMPRFFLQYTG